MNFEKVKQAYLNESSDFMLATEKQIDKLSEWLDANDYHNAAHMRWEDDQEEWRCMQDSLAREFGINLNQ
jgi:hypothetical protein